MSLLSSILVQLAASCASWVCCCTCLAAAVVHTTNNCIICWLCYEGMYDTHLQSHHYQSPRRLLMQRPEPGIRW